MRMTLFNLAPISHKIAKQQIKSMKKHAKRRAPLLCRGVCLFTILLQTRAPDHAFPCASRVKEACVSRRRGVRLYGEACASMARISRYCTFVHFKRSINIPLLFTSGCNRILLLGTPKILQNDRKSLETALPRPAEFRWRKLAKIESLSAVCLPISSFK